MSADQDESSMLAGEVSMLGRRSVQRDLVDLDSGYADVVGRGSFYGWLAGQGEALFPDALFADFWHKRWGRPSRPPSLLATATRAWTRERDHAAGWRRSWLRPTTF